MTDFELSYLQQLIEKSVNNNVELSMTCTRCEWFSPPCYTFVFKSACGEEAWPALSVDKASTLVEINNLLERYRLITVQNISEHYDIKSITLS